MPRQNPTTKLNGRVIATRVSERKATVRCEADVGDAGDRTEEENRRRLLRRSSCKVRVAWLRTNGVNTNGVTAKVLLFDGFGERTQNVRKFDGF